MRNHYATAGVFAVALAGGSARAHADVWLVAEAPAALAISDAQEGAFRPGVMPAVGLYTSGERVALGLRMRAGVLRNGPDPGDNLRDPGAGGLGTVGVALRYAIQGAWVEGVAGGGITGHDLVPAIEAGVGWTFAVGSVDLGPSVRYARVMGKDTMPSFGSADLLLAGVDLRFGVSRPRHTHPVRLVAAAPLPAPPPVDRVPDDVVERDTSCAEILDGCRVSDEIVIRDSRIVLSDRVLFDFDRARVRSHGREVIAQIAQLWKRHPEWKHLSIEGHTDVRGDDAYNQDLSERRARSVLDVLVANGADADAMEAVGFGRSHPVSQGDSELSHAANRRVEFVIDQRVAPRSTP